MLSSLVPGAIFHTSGFNRKSTPTPPDVTPQQLDQRYRRDKFDGKDWPHESPISRAYDVQNTSTKMIILNNKYGKGATRLRGYYSGPKRSERFVDPDRHGASSPRSPEFHHNCLDSSSPKFEPSIKTNIEWVNSSVRPPNSLSARSAVNPRHHMSCRVPTDPPAFYSGHGRPHSRMSLPPPRYFSEYSDLSIGEKIYLWSIEKVYNVENMKQLKQEQYQKLLQLEARKGNHTSQEYERYLQYIGNANKRSHGTGSASPSSRRAQSAFSHRSKSARSSPVKGERNGEEKENAGDQNKRPKTSYPRVQHETTSDSKTRTKSAQSDRSKATTSASASRKSSAKSTRSTQSAKSKASSHASSVKSAKSSEKGDNPDDSSGNKEEETTAPKHKEGVDRPKSRLGHKTADDRDQASIRSSISSVKSDHHTTSEDSGIENNQVTKSEKREAPSGSTKQQYHDNHSISSKSSKSSKSSRSTIQQNHDNHSISSRSSRSSKSSFKSNSSRNKINGSRTSINSRKSESTIGSRSSLRAQNQKAEDDFGSKGSLKGSKKSVEESSIRSDCKSVGSQGSHNSLQDTKEAKGDNKLEEGDDETPEDMTVHHVPSADIDEKREDAGERKTDGNREDAKDSKTDGKTDNATVEDVKETKVSSTEETSEVHEQHEKDTHAHVHFSANNQIDEVKDKSDSNENNAAEAVKSNSDGTRKIDAEAEETEGGVDVKTGEDASPKNKLYRQDSFDDDEDRRGNKDIEKIEY